MWVVLSHVLLQEGKDWPEAEKVLLRVLQLEPNNAGARNNLEILRQQQARRREGR